MKRRDLEHIIRAACTIADDDELVIVGSQAILGQFPDAPGDLLVSMEADVYPKHFPERADLVDAAIGELSMFHETFGYYADGVGPDTAVLPSGWEDRLIAIRGPGTAGNTGWALEVHDLVVSKYVAARENSAFAPSAHLAGEGRPTTRSRHDRSGPTWMSPRRIGLAQGLGRSLAFTQN